MLCAAAPISSHDGFLGLLTGPSTSSAMGSQVSSCKVESSYPELSFSWSDFPVLGQGSSDSMDLPPAMVEIEDPWNGEDSSADSRSACSFPSDDSISRHSSLSVATLVEDEETTSDKAILRKVRFSNVLSIRTFDVTLGDHPCCVGGMAITCDWTHAEQDECIDLDVYERYAPPKRSLNELRLSYHERRSRLQAAMGMSPAQLLQLEYDMVCAAPMNVLRPCSSVNASLQALSAYL